MTRNVQSGCRLSGNGRQQETLARAAPGRPCSRHRHNLANNSFETTFEPIPTQVRFNILWYRRRRAPFNPHRHSTAGPRRSTPRFPPSRLVQRLPTCAVAHSRRCRQGQASNNPEQNGRSCLKTLGAGYSHAMLTIKLFALSLTIRHAGRFLPVGKVPCQASFAVCLNVHRIPVDRSAHFASTTSSIPTSGTLPSNDSECLASSRGT
jgi:hypothetical protein